jgi:hypothetical protein
MDVGPAWVGIWMSLAAGGGPTGGVNASLCRVRAVSVLDQGERFQILLLKEDQEPIHDNSLHDTFFQPGQPQTWILSPLFRR